MAAVSMAVSLEYLPGRGATAELAPMTLLGCPLSHCSGRWLSALTRGEHSSIFARTLFDRPVQQDKAEPARDKHHNFMRVSYWRGIFEKHEHL